jgi:hypothetical protein
MQADTAIHDEIHVSGVLADDAVLGFMPGANDKHTAMLSFTIAPAVGLPYFVRMVMGTDPAAQIAARAKVRDLRKGTPVTVYAAGLRAQSDHDRAGLRLLKVTDVITRDTTASRIEAHNEEH